MSYAQKTKVSVDKSQAEIRKTLAKYNASGFVFGENNGKAVVMFEMKSRRLKFVFDLPIKGKAVNQKGYILGDAHLDQETRRLWRCLAILIKGNLEAVESGIVLFEEIFLSNFMLPNGQTVSEAMVPQIAQAYAEKQMPPLLGYR